MKILFYLPVVTPWWFTELLTPLIRSLHGDAELHVMVAPIWRNTGIEGDHLAPLADLDGIHWHVIDHEDPDLFRRDGAAVPGLLDLVHEIAPDLTIARSADFTTPMQFPGLVRYLMEGWLPPFAITSLSLMLEPQPFRLGVMPEGSDALIDACTDALGDLWSAPAAIRTPILRQDWRTALGLPAQRPILAVPLAYEHEECYFQETSAFPRGLDLLLNLLNSIDPQVFLAVTDHPLNRKYVDRSDIAALIAEVPERAALCVLDDVPGGPTGILAVRGDAMLVEQGKSWATAAYCGTPMLHFGNSDTAGWLNCAELDFASGTPWSPETLRKPDMDAARRFFSWHFGTRVFDPGNVSLDRLIAHVNGTTGADVIDANMAVLRDNYRVAA